MWRHLSAAAKGFLKSFVMGYSRMVLPCRCILWKALNQKSNPSRKSRRRETVLNFGCLYMRRYVGHLFFDAGGGVAQDALLEDGEHTAAGTLADFRANPAEVISICRR